MLGLSITCATCADVITIPEIDVASSTPQQTQTTGNSINYDQQNIQSQGAISTLDFLNKQAIVQVQSHSNQQNQTSLSIHGFGNNAGQNTLILVDGVPLNSFTDIGPNINSILLNNIQQIRISPGSYGTLYGDQAVGGVVNITTYIPDTPTTDVEAGLGNLSQKLGQFYLSRPVNPHIKYSVGGMIYDTSHDQLHNLQNNYNLNSQIQYTGQQDTAKLSLYAYQTAIQIPDPMIWPTGRGAPAQRSAPTRL